MKRFLIERKGYIDFSSNDYLGMARNPLLKARIDKEISKSCVHGSTGSRLLTGHSEYTNALERKIAAFHRSESALIYNSGYVANLGLVTSLVKSNIIYDIGVHASTYDALKLTQATKFPFRHNDILHLERRLQQVARGQIFVCVESIYSMDGTIAPLKNIAELCKKYQAHLIVDEAHSVGVMGENGEGLVAHLGLEKEVYARVCTYGKAFGVFGAAILGSFELREFLINSSRALWYTTALPPYNIVAIDCAYDLVKGAKSERKQLFDLITEFQRFAKNGLKTPIQPIDIPAKSYQLTSAGIDVRPIFPPTVKKECLRICLHAFNTFEEIHMLFEVLHCAS